MATFALITIDQTAVARMSSLLPRQSKDCVMEDIGNQFEHMDKGQARRGHSRVDGTSTFKSTARFQANERKRRRIA